MNVPAINVSTANPAGVYGPAGRLARLPQVRAEQFRTPHPFADTLNTVDGRYGAEMPSSIGTGHQDGLFNRVKDFVAEVDHKDKVSADLRRQVMAGDSTNLHQAIIASQEAGVSFSLMVEMRNKVLETYQELMRLQV